MFAKVRSSLIKYFFFGNSITNDGYLRLAYLIGRFVVFLPLSLLATFVLGIYSLFRPVKIFMLRCERSKISFIVEDLEVALRIEAHNEKTTGVRRPLIFAVLDCESPNRAFTAMYGRVVPFFDDDRPFSRGIIRYTLPVFRIKKTYLGRRQAENQLKIWAASKPILTFTNDEITRGELFQSQLLNYLDQAFVCIGISEPQYYEIKHEPKRYTKSERDIYSCMPSWQNYISCTQALAHESIKSVRMGQHASINPVTISNSQIVDYASSARSEYNDVWLLKENKFVIAGGCGVHWLASAWNKPCVLTDTYSLFNTSYGKFDLFIPQLGYSRSKKKLMKLTWMIAQGPAWAQNRSLVEGDIEIIKNTPEEITEVVLEMNQRIDGTWIESDEDIELQERFRQLRASIPTWQVQQGVRIGAAFLRRYKHLL